MENRPKPTIRLSKNELRSFAESMLSVKAKDQTDDKFPLLSAIYSSILPETRPQLVNEVAHLLKIGMRNQTKLSKYMNNPRNKINA